MGKFLDVSPKFFFLADLSICLLTPSNIFSITSCCLALLLWLFRWDPGSQDRPREDKISLEKKDLSMTLKYLGRKTQFTYFTSLLKLSIIIILWYFPFERSHEVLIGTVKPVYKSLKEYHSISIFNTFIDEETTTSKKSCQEGMDLFTRREWWKEGHFVANLNQEPRTERHWAQ